MGSARELETVFPQSRAQDQCSLIATRRLLFCWWLERWSSSGVKESNLIDSDLLRVGYGGLISIGSDRSGSVAVKGRVWRGSGQCGVVKVASYGIMQQTESWRLVEFSFWTRATCWTQGLYASAQVSQSVLAVWGRPGLSQHVSHAYASRR